MGTPVSWYAIEPGWRVASRDGVRVGKVEAVLGDEELDIFHGVSVRVGLGYPRREIPADLVSEIVDGTVTLGLSAEEIGSLPAR